MKISRLGNIFVGIISTIVVAAGALSAQAANPVGSAPGEQYIGKPTAALEETAGRGQITIRIASWYQESYLTHLKDYLGVKFPDYTFEYLYLEKNNYEALMDDQLATKSAPDVVCVDPAMAKKHAKNGYLMDLTELTSDFNTYGREPFAYNGKVYAVPNTCNYECFYYDRKMFEECNWKVPETFEEFLETCDYFRLEKGLKPLAAGFKDEITIANSGSLFTNAGYFQSLYGNTFGDRIQFGKASFYRELYDDLKLWDMMIDHDVFTKEMYLLDKKGAIEEFALGEAAIFAGEPTDFNSIMELNPDMEIGVFVILSKKTGNCPVIGGNECGFAVNINGDHTKEAKAVVASLSSLSGQSALWSDRIGSQTYLSDVHFQNPECFEPMKEIIEENRLTNPYYTWGPNSRELYQIFGRELQQVLVERKTLEFALQDMDRQAQIIREEE